MSFTLAASETAIPASKIDKNNARPEWYFLPASVFFATDRVPFGNCQSWAQDTLSACQAQR